MSMLGFHSKRQYIVDSNMILLHSLLLLNNSPKVIEKPSLAVDTPTKEKPRLMPGLSNATTISLSCYEIEMIGISIASHGAVNPNGSSIFGE